MKCVSERHIANFNGCTRSHSGQSLSPDVDEVYGLLINFWESINGSCGFSFKQTFFRISEKKLLKSSKVENNKFKNLRSINLNEKLTAWRIERKGRKNQFISSSLCLFFSFFAWWIYEKLLRADCFMNSKHSLEETKCCESLTIDSFSPNLKLFNVQFRGFSAFVKALKRSNRRGSKEYFSVDLTDRRKHFPLLRKQFTGVQKPHHIQTGWKQIGRLEW